VRGLQVAGKTGTAEFGPRFADGPTRCTVTSGFAPADDPQIAVTVFLERGIGATHAAPLASKILDYYFHRNDNRADAGSAPTGTQP
jgi:cell division protein FtsI/penicillin-binding protein 2